VVTTLFALLVRLFPPGFRQRFAAEMLEQLRTDHAQALSRGRLSALAFSLASVWDLVHAALAERAHATWLDGHGRPIRSGGMTMSEWVGDIGFAVRALSKSPGFAAVSVLTLGLAIGANASIFSVVDRVLLDPLPFDEVDELVTISASAPGSDLPPEFPVSSEFYLQYEESERLASLAIYNSFTSTLRTGDRVERVRMSFPTPSLFETLGAAPMLGRLPTAEDEDGVTVLSHALWTSWFASDPTVLGRSVYASGGMRTIIGVMGPEFWFPSADVLLWVPFPVRTERVVPGQFGGQFRLVARVAEGGSHDALVEDLTMLARRLPERFGGSPTYARIIEQHRAVVRPLREQLLGDVSGPIWILMGAVGMVLLIACANVANLFLVRSEDRLRDLAVRRALGADRARLVRAAISETVVIAALAGALAVLVAWAGLPLLLAASPPNVPGLASAGLGTSTLLFAAGASFFCALACGVAPALRSSAPDLVRLRAGSRGATLRRHRARNALVAAQTALALVLLIGSALLLRSFRELRRVDPGYDVRDVFTFQIGVEDEEALVDGPTYARFHLDFADRLAALPGVESVGIIENVPLNEGVATGRFRAEEGVDDDEAATLLSYTWAGGDYYGAMGIEVLEGRPFVADDHAVGVGNVVLGRRAADVLWPGESAVGRRLRSDATQAWYTVVGVVEDVLQYGFRDEAEPLLYFPLVGPTASSWALSSPAYVMKTPRAAEIAPEVRALVREAAPSAPMYRVFTMEGLAADSMVQLSFTMLALGIASTLALMLGAVGLYGILSYVVAQRTREIGVRMALGAEAQRVQRMVVAQGARVVLVGVVLGAAIAAGATRVLEGLLFGVEPADAGTFLVMSASMVLVGLLASYLPARRASSVDPIESLRGD
jgi:putative ABC transport system permease protein